MTWGTWRSRGSDVDDTDGTSSTWTGDSRLDELRAVSLRIDKLTKDLRRHLDGFVRPRIEAAAEHELGDDFGPIRALLDRLRLRILEHPAAAQALFAALVAEGRWFAQTEDGQAWARKLERSKLLAGSRRIWDALSLGMIAEDPDTTLPSAYVELLAQAARREDVEDRLRRYGR